MPSPELSPRLLANLRALAQVDRGLVERLLLPAADGHVRLEGERVLYRFHRGWTDLEGLAPEVPAAPRHLWIGVGAGDQLAAALQAQPGATFVAYERDPWMLRLALMRHDWSEALQRGRLRLVLGVDHLDFEADGANVIEHPVLGALYAPELTRITSDGPARPRVGVFVGKLFVGDLMRCLAGRGFEAVVLDDQNWSTEELSYAVRRAQLTGLARINYTSGLAEFAEEQDLPLLVWEIDPATDQVAPPRTATERTHVFTYREANVEVYRGAGFVNVEHLPLAAPVDRRRPLPAQDLGPYRAPVAFVGASLMDTAALLEERLARSYAAFAGPGAVQGFQRRCRALLDQQARAGRWTLEGMFAAEFPEYLAAARAVPGGEDPVQLLGERAAAERRRALVELVADQGIHVWGDDGFADAQGVIYRGPAKHGDELTAIYNAAQIQIDIGRWYQSDIVTMRVFDVLACGGFLIAERSAALEALFDVGRELETYSTPSELRAKVRYYLDHPDEARAIAAAGRRAVLERHDFGARVDHMLETAGLVETATMR